jgi:AhpD family alkylhydroperoxidase
MKNPAMLLPELMQPLQAVGGQAGKHLPEKTLGLVHLRASQINGCSVCLDMHAHAMKKSGETEERMNAVAGWRHAPYYTDAERAALALTEAITRLADREDPVPDALWQEAARHFDERELAALVVHIGVVNLWNRLNVATAQVAGSVRWDG